MFRVLILELYRLKKKVCSVGEIISHTCGDEDKRCLFLILLQYKARMAL